MHFFLNKLHLRVYQKKKCKLLWIFIARFLGPIRDPLLLLPTRSHTIKFEVHQTWALADCRCSKLSQGETHSQAIINKSKWINNLTNQIIWLMPFLIQSKATFIASALQSKLLWRTATTSLPFFLFYDAIFSKIFQIFYSWLVHSCSLH